MGVASKSTGKKLNVTEIKPQVDKLVEIKLEPIDLTAIKSQVDKVAINTSPTENKKIESHEEISKELEPDYIKPLSQKIFGGRPTGASSPNTWALREEQSGRVFFRYAYKYFGIINLDYIVK